MQNEEKHPAQSGQKFHPQARAINWAPTLQQPEDETENSTQKKQTRVLLPVCWVSGPWAEHMDLIFQSELIWTEPAGAGCPRRKKETNTQQKAALPTPHGERNTLSVYSQAQSEAQASEIRDKQ